jgi:hypothetical protein
MRASFIALLTESLHGVGGDGLVGIDPKIAGYGGL